MRASSKGVRSGRTFSPPTPFVLGPKASSRAHFDFDCGHRLRGKFRPCQGSDGYTDSWGLRASVGTRFGSDGRAFREAAFFSFLFSHFVGPDRGARRIVRKAGAAAPDALLVRLVRLVLLVAVDAPRPSSQRLHIPATIAMLVALSSPSFISSPGAFRLGPFASGFSSSTSTRFSSGIAPERPIPLSDTMPTRCRPSGLSGRACRGGGR